MNAAAAASSPPAMISLLVVTGLGSLEIEEAGRLLALDRLNRPAPFVNESRTQRPSAFAVDD
jgi:putative NADH-flavin reductase